MKKCKLIFLSIITFGIYYVIILNKAKKASKVINNSLQHSTQINFNIDDFISILGGTNNIKSCNSTISSITFQLESPIEINKAIYKQYDIHGISKSYNKLTIIFGDNAPAIGEEIDKRIDEQKK
jgi:phosphotransferase system IIB component